MRFAGGHLVENVATSAMAGLARPSADSLPSWELIGYPCDVLADPGND